MNAIHHTAYGAPHVLVLNEAPRPARGDHDVLVAVHASAVTHGDRRLRTADFPGIGWLPGRLMTGLVRPRRLVPGTTYAGRVVAIGAAVTRFAAGDDVFGLGTHGAYAEYLAVPEGGAIARKPASLDPAEAAALPYGATTALTFLRDLAGVQPGERVAVLGASGEVGRFAVQLARHLGAEVTGVCSRDHDLVAELGAQHVVDYTREDFTAGGRRYDVVFDTSETNQFGRCRGALTEHGRYLTLQLSLQSLAQMAMTSVLGGPRSMCGVSVADQEKLDAVRELVEAGAMRSVIAGRFPLDRTADAHAFLEAGRARGSVVVEVVPAL
ncbi:MAG: NAD(P)-dependent alcohol dehydrogenase [Pseudomonadota bacterium]|nr:NAD(P)-dependent alcohol dehydrogenase [Pseudomonadota bacterium]